MRIGYIKSACEGMEMRVLEVVRKMFECRADKRNEVVKMGAIVPLHRQGYRNDRENYRGVCLLSMRNRVLGRLIGKRLGL